MNPDKNGSNKSDSEWVLKILFGKMGITCQDVWVAPGGSESFEDELDGDAGAADDRLAGESLGISG